MDTIQGLRSAVAQRLEAAQPAIVSGVLDALVARHRKFGPTGSSCRCEACALTFDYVQYKRRGSRETLFARTDMAMMLVKQPDPAKVQEMRIRAREAREQMSFLEMSSIVI